MSFTIHPDKKTKAPVSRKGPAQKTGDLTQQDKRPPPKKGDTITISDEGKEKDKEQQAAKGDVSDEFEESAQDDDRAPEQDPKPKSTAGSAINYDRQGKMNRPIEKKSYGAGFEGSPPDDNHPTIDLDS